MPPNLMQSPSGAIIESAGGLDQEALKEAKAKNRERAIKRLRKEGISWGAELFEAIDRNELKFSTLKESLRQESRNQPAVLRETILTNQLYSAISGFVTNDVRDSFDQYNAVYEVLAQLETSNEWVEYYPEEFMEDRPVKVSETEPAPEARMSGSDYKVYNDEYARILGISRRLFDGDKLGRIKRRIAKFGQSWKKEADRLWLTTLFRTISTANSACPTSSILGNGGQVPSVPGPLTPVRIQDGLTQSGQAVDPYGDVITWTPDTLLIDSNDRMNARRFLTSLYSPVGFGSGSTGYSADASPGPFSENILNGLLQIVFSPYVKLARGILGSGGNASGYPALLMKAKEGHVMQFKKPLTIEMEPPAGRSFDTRSYRWQATIEMGAGNVQPRIFIALN